MLMKNSLLFVLLLFSQAYAITVVNSLDGRDVISAVYYAAFFNDKIVIAYPNSDPQLVYSAVGINNNVFLVQSEKNPVITGLADTLKQKGNNVEVFLSKEPYETNLKLAEKSRAKKFIFVDPLYGYNAVSALAYAKQNKMVLIFAEKNNSEKILSLLDSRSPSETLVYGYIDNEIKEALAKKGISYKEINNGDKFNDNLELLDIYLKENPSKKQVIICDGNGIEDTIAAGDEPVIFIGQVVPISVYNYLKGKVANNQISVGMLIDKDYTQTVYSLKQSINNELGQKKLNILVKIGQSVGGQEGTPSAVPIFPLRGPISGLDIEKAEYNSVMKTLEVTYKNTGNAEEYVKSSIVVYLDGKQFATIGDERPFVLQKGAVVGRAYPLNIEEGRITANITSYFGISRENLDAGIVKFFDIGRIEYVDNSKIEIASISVDKESGDIVAVFTNTGQIPAYFRADVIVNVANKTIKIEDSAVHNIKPNEGRAVKFSAIGKGSTAIKTGAFYGAREAFLNKRVEKDYVAESASFDITLLLGGVVVLLLLVVIYLFATRKK